MTKEKKLAIMKNVGYGCRDVGKPCLFFDVYVSECIAALQILFGKDADKLLTDSRTYDVKQLEGKSCWVEVEGNTIKFKEIANI